MIHVWRQHEPAQLQHRHANSRKKKSKPSDRHSTGSELPNLMLIFQAVQAHAFSHPAESDRPMQSIASDEGSPDDAFTQALDAFCEHDHVLPSAPKESASVQGLGQSAHVFVLVLCDPFQLGHACQCARSPVQDANKRSQAQRQIDRLPCMNSERSSSPCRLPRDQDMSPLAPRGASNGPHRQCPAARRAPWPAPPSA